MKTVAFYTLGCKVNTYDTSFMQELFINKGYTIAEFGNDVDVVVINTCTVTAMADKKSRAAIRKASKTGKVIVAGCMAQKQSQKLLEMDGVDAVIGTDDRAKVVEVAQQLLDGHKNIDVTHSLDGCEYEKMVVTTSGVRTRGVIKIQEGCNNFCSYCIIPYVRGRSRSRSLVDIVDEAKVLSKSGVKELVLTGIHIASYNDEGYGLGDVVCELDKISGIRIRLGSIEPVVLGEAFIKQVASAKSLCPHFHLSLQSGSASVLERMNRKYTPNEYFDFVQFLRKYFDNPAITTDIITGFPGETQQEHEDTLAFVKQVAFSRIHVFPFSAREGTKAYDMSPKISRHVAKERAAELINLGEIYEKKYLASMQGYQAEVLFEDGSSVFDGCLEGYSRRYIRVAAKAEKNELKIVTIKEICEKIALGSSN